MRAIQALPLALLLVGCQSHNEASSPAATAPAPAATTMPAGQGVASQAHWEGFGDMRFGMDEAAFRQAWGGDLKGGAEPGSDCAMFAPTWAKTPPALTFMLEHGHFVRYDVRDDKTIAPGGGKVGMDKAQLISLYAGKGKHGADKYDAGASVFRVEGPNDTVLIFDIGADGNITAWRVGVPPQIDYVEGCS